ncbi:protein of unknown function DUF124 [Streptantibioticus cattleyicolor NRRL 8057 = DSM 46488]|uniref:Uncharacterized protein n=1 Tax=Streptantibioticus cattleyicolor (strain ATCC 35852 / DSM 46488 / JCM 4925 / NBRC 14057 / NRRL 8057) TaxID=1003195 RepID=G8X345_STREN|nr:protein of unknown function DUF124 [Streptantibioticus cattleyicolor NRRL 8057 = DSM 46488]
MLTGFGGTSGEEHQLEFTGAGQVLLQSSEKLLPEQETGTVPDGPGVPGARPGSEGAAGTGLFGQLGEVERRFGR